MHDKLQSCDKRQAITALHSALRVPCPCVVWRACIDTLDIVCNHFTAEEDCLTLAACMLEELCEATPC